MASSQETPFHAEASLELQSWEMESEGSGAAWVHPRMSQFEKAQVSIGLIIHGTTVMAGNVVAGSLLTLPQCVRKSSPGCFSLNRPSPSQLAEGAFHCTQTSHRSTCAYGPPVVSCDSGSVFPPSEALFIQTAFFFLSIRYWRFIYFCGSIIHAPHFKL